MNNRYKKIGLAAVLVGSLTLTSCSDFLTIKPLNDVVVENYWEKKSEVAAVVASCYYDMQKAAFTQRLIAWGELRGDNVTETSNLQNNTTTYDFFTNNITTNNYWNDWSAFYNVINLCNTVLYYAPQTQQVDGTFTAEELHSYEAEVKAIRSLCYFYLVRTFKKVPLVTTASIGDDVDFKVPASSEEDVLGFIETELKEASQYIWNRTYFDDNADRKGRFNKQSVKALLADVYLWEGKYQECADLCGEILSEKKAEYEKQQQEMENGTYSSYVSNGALSLYEGYPLIDGSQSSHYAYNWLYYTGNSFESILELQFTQEANLENSGISFFYGDRSNVGSGLLNAASFLCVNDASSLFSDENDERLFENTGYESGKTSSAYYVRKYRYYYGDANQGTLRATFANWIVYKLTDIMLMRAEALAYLGGDANSEEAFALVKAVNERYCGGESKLTYDASNIKKMVLDERQRETLFEGKRWYDLVRMVRHADDPVKAMSELRSSYLIRKYGRNGQDAVARMGSLNNLFLPYYQSEVDVNPLLKPDQNPSYQ